MRMFTPSGKEVVVDKTQIPALEEQGWTKTLPEVKDEPAKTPEDGDNVGETKSAPVRKKRIIKPKG